MRTLSARILLGFIALTFTFGSFAATILWNLREVEERRPETTQLVSSMVQQVSRTAPLYDAVLAAPPPRVPAKTDPAFQAAYDALDAPHQRAYDALVQLRDAERKFSSSTTNLQA